MEYDNITSDEGEENHGGKNGIKNQPWLRKSEPVNKPIKISVIKSTISLPTQELNRKSQRSAVLNFRAIDSIGDSDVGDLTPEGPNEKCNPPGADGVSNAILFRGYHTE